MSRRGYVCIGGKSALEIALTYGHHQVLPLLSNHWSVIEHRFFPKQFRRRALATILAFQSRLESNDLNSPLLVFEMVFSCWNRAEVLSDPTLI